MLSRRADYGVRAMMDIAAHAARERVVVAEIARRQEIPASFLAKIIPRLVRAGLVRTSLGATGGITLALPPEEISLLHIIEAIEGPFALNLCSLEPTRCKLYATCSACAVWGKAQNQLNHTLAQTRLSDLVASYPPPRVARASTRRSLSGLEQSNSR
jgi:Rrf2 family iron-sulfur cluster assembly transcriptional regulator